MAKRGRRNFSRREFLQTAGAVAGGVAAASLADRVAQGAGGVGGTGAGARWSVSLMYDPKDPVASSGPAQWAAKGLRDALTSKGIHVDWQMGDAGAGQHSIIAVGPTSKMGKDFLDQMKQTLPAAPESAALVPAPAGARELMAAGSDSLGLVYALTELTDRVKHAADAAGVRAALEMKASVTESPASKIRGIFRMFVSEVEDKRWFYDKEGWEKYFDMLVTNRFNRFNLSFGLSYDFSTGLTDTYTFFMYPFFVDVPGYAVKAVAKSGAAVPAEEQKKNLEMLKFISDQAAMRGLQFNLGIWTHNYRWTNSPNATHTIEGLNAQTQAPYSRDAMKMILQACPGITGITLRTHGESGVPEGSYDLWKIIMAGIVGHKNADGSARVIELDLHGKTMTKEMIDTAESTGQPVTISCKMWAEHMGLPYMQASIREAEMPKGRDAGGLMALSNGTRSFLRYGVGDLLQKGRKYKVIHRVWPGTQRLLLWGDPLYAAEYGKAAAFAGMDGIEYFEPLSFRGRAGSSMNIPAAKDRSGYKVDALRTERDWEKYLYTFRLWGRLAYNPETDKEVWQRQLKREFGDTGESMEKALANASRVLPLVTTAHLPAAANFQYWPEVYVNQSIHNPNNNTYSEAPTPRVFGNVSSLDPQMFATVNEYAGSLLDAKPLAKVSPLEVARQLDHWVADALAAVGKVANGGLPAFIQSSRALPATQQRVALDTLIAFGLGNFFGSKIRAAILWQIFNLSGHEPARVAALDSYKQAREFWSALADTAKVYLPDLTFGPDRQLRRHWSDRLADIDADIAGMATRGPNLRGMDYQKETIDKLITSVLNPPEPAFKLPATVTHKPAGSFKANQPFEVALSCGQPVPAAITEVRLWYRHLHQGERYASLPMGGHMADFVATIPADFTNSPFPIQYYFEIRTVATATLFPGFKENFAGTPYFVVMPE